MQYGRKTQKSAEENAARQEALYAFLSQRAGKWTSMEMCTDTIRMYPAFFTTTYHNSTARRMLTEDIEAINASHDYEKVIISGNRGIKLADRSEYERFIKAEFTEIFRKLKRLRKMAQKAGLDGQSQIWGEIREAFLEEE